MKLFEKRYAGHVKPEKPAGLILRWEICNSYAGSYLLFTNDLDGKKANLFLPLLKNPTLRHPLTLP